LIIALSFDGQYINCTRLGPRGININVKIMHTSVIACFRWPFKSCFEAS